MAVTTPKPIPHRFPEELVSSTLFLLKRLGMAAKEQSFAEYAELGLHPYHHAILVVLDEGSRETRDRSPTRSATTAGSSSACWTSSRRQGSSCVDATRPTDGGTWSR